MGSFFSKEAKGLGSDPRPPLIYSSLQFLDLVLIRSRVSVNGFGMDSRIASTIRYGSLGMQVPEAQQFSKWDRVGLIQLPSFIEKHEYDADNIEVTEATYFGIQTRTLRQVLDSSLEVSVRSIKMGAQIERADQEEMRRRQREANGEVESKEDEAAASAEAEELENDDANDRLEYLQKYYQFTGPIINRAYGQCMDKLESMFRFVMSSLKSYDLSSVELTLMDSILDQYTETFTGQDGRTAHGIPFQRLLPLFRDISQSAAKNTFSDSEIFELVGAFNLGDDHRVSLSNDGFISKAEFMTQWRASLERTLPLRKLPREILSGAFVSQALQCMGLLPTQEDAYYLPMDFAMIDPPVGGWTHDEHGVSKPRTAAQVEAERQARLKIYQQRLQEAQRENSSSSSSASAAAAIEGAPSHHAMQLAPEEIHLDGAAIERVHSHGVARIGIEHQVLPPPPQMHREKETERERDAAHRRG